MDILEALANLDTLDDDQWTSEGLPKIDTMKELLGRPVTRQEIIDAAPQFNRENPIEQILQDQKDDENTDPILNPDLISDFGKTNPMDPNSFLGFLNTVPKNQLQELKDLLDAQKKETVDARKKIDDFEYKINNSLVMVKARIRNEIPDISDREANQAYIRSQAELRAKKKAATVALLKGVDLNSLDPRAPIDRAMARKTQRGTMRPGT